MIVAIYARVSTKDQNCDIQLGELREWCARHNWAIFREYVDRAVHGDTASRAGLDAMMEAARKRLFDAVVVVKLDRFGRSVMHLTNALNKLEGYGVRFIATSQNIDTDKSNPTGRLLLHILAAVAEFEKSLIVERTTAGVRAAIARGIRVGGPIKIFDRSAADRLYEEGKSLRSISRELGVPFSTLRGDFARRGRLVP
jgi:putative DNA-invertase from lambdoid prophage Rac